MFKSSPVVCIPNKHKQFDYHLVDDFFIAIEQYNAKLVRQLILHYPDIVNNRHHTVNTLFLSL